MRTARRSYIPQLLLATALLGAGPAITHTLQAKAAVLAAQSMPKVIRKWGFFGMIPRRNASARFRSKPWTCTAIEKRKAAKRRNIKRERARRRK